jgi:Ohr subfamily peroxiredoxin
MGVGGDFAPRRAPGAAPRLKEDLMDQSDKVIYTARTHTIGGRQGQSRSDDGNLEVRLATPGTHAVGTNPEQLFAAGWSACFEAAVAEVARARRVKLPDGVTIDAEVDLRKGDSSYSIAARLNATIPGVDRALAEELLEEADQTCPYSKATRGNIEAVIRLV